MQNVRAQMPEYILNNIRMKRFSDKILITTDHGEWIALDKRDYIKLLRYEIDEDIFKLLREKGIIITKDNLNLILDKYRQKYDFLFSGTSLHIILPTLRCNQRCIYCHSSSRSPYEKQYDMDEETAKKCLEFIFQTPANLITIEFQGGDSLLNLKVLKFIVGYAKNLNKGYKKDIRFALVTNLTLMNEEILDFIIKNKVHICTSLDGPKEIHNKNRFYFGGGGTYDDVTKWMKKIKEKANYDVSALMVTTRYSLPYWKEIVDEYVKWGIRSLQIKYINKLGYAAETWSKIGYTTDEFLEFWRKCVDYMIELNKKGIKIKERYVGLILTKILENRDPSFLDFRSPCGTVIGQMAYNYNGDIYSCDEGRTSDIFKLGNVKENTFKEILASPHAHQLISSSINENYLCDVCIYKPYCGICPVMNFVEENTLIPSLPKNSHCKSFKMMFDYVFEKLLFDEGARKIFLNWACDWQKE